MCNLVYIKLIFLYKILNIFLSRNKIYFLFFDVRFLGVCDLGLMSDAVV